MKRLIDLLLLPPVLLIGLLYLVSGLFLIPVDAVSAWKRTRSVRYVLWMLGLRKSCPYCHGELKEHGWRPQERYSCPTEGCRFNEEG